MKKFLIFGIKQEVETEQNKYRRPHILSLRYPTVIGNHFITYN